MYQAPMARVCKQPRFPWPEALVSLDVLRWTFSTGAIMDLGTLCRRQSGRDVAEQSLGSPPATARIAGTRAS